MMLPSLAGGGATVRRTRGFAAWQEAQQQDFQQQEADKQDVYQDNLPPTPPADDS